MSSQPKDIVGRKARAIVELPCDGVNRFEVRGSVMAFKVPYSLAFVEVFRLAGGTLAPGLTPDAKPTRVFTPEAVRRITALNTLYAPYARKVFEAQKAAADLLKRPAEPTVAP